MILLNPFIILKAKEIYSAKPEIVRRVISDKTASRVKDILKSVVNNGTEESS